MEESWDLTPCLCELVLILWQRRRFLDLVSGISRCWDRALSKGEGTEQDRDVRAFPLWLSSNESDLDP